MKELVLSDILKTIPRRAPDSNKSDYGSLLAVVGSTNYRGAAVLSAMGALRTGVGILRVASVEEVMSAVCSSVPEATFIPLSDISDLDINNIPKTTAVLCGCGLGRGDAVSRTVRSIVEGCGVPLVLDADGLNNIDAQILCRSKTDVIITPHVGEFSRLSGLSAEEIKADREGHAKEFADKYGVTVVLKDNYTVIASPANETAVSRYGNAGLARGGSGDVLAGMIASFAAQGMEAYDAAVCGVTLHGAAADRCAKRMSVQCMLPHDILVDLCEIFREEGR